MQTVTLQDLTKTLPHLDPVPIEGLCCTGKSRKIPGKIVVLDDDPTGVQTVHDIYVYTDCTLASIREGFSRPERSFLLTDQFPGTYRGRDHGAASSDCAGSGNCPRRPISPSRSFYAEILLCAGIIRWNRF